jgi:general secretion pathway protein C
LNLTELVRSSGPRIILALEIAMVLGLAVQSARLVWTVAVPGGALKARPVVSRPPTDLGVLASFDAFGAQGAPGASPAQASFRLFGVRAGGVGGGSAIIAGPDGVQKSYAVGDPVADGLTLAAVAADHIELSRGGAPITLSFPGNP